MKNLFVLFFFACMAICIQFANGKRLPGGQSPYNADNVAYYPDKNIGQVPLQPFTFCDFKGSAAGLQRCIDHCTSKGYSGGKCDAMAVCYCKK